MTHLASPVPPVPTPGRPAGRGLVGSWRWRRRGGGGPGRVRERRRDLVLVVPSKSKPKVDPNAPVEDQLGFDSAGIMARQSRVEASIRDCMKAQGFDYVPVDPYAQRAAVTGASRLSDEEFLRQFGYGISTLWGRGGQQADPNERIRRSLGPADRAAYERALWGENAGSTFAAAVDSGDFTKLGGCTRRATEASSAGRRCSRSSRAGSTSSTTGSWRTSGWSARSRSGPRAWPRRATTTRTPTRSTGS